MSAEEEEEDDEEEDDEEEVDNEESFELELESSAKVLSIGIEQTKRHLLAVSSIFSLGSMIESRREIISISRKSIQKMHSYFTWCHLQLPALSLTPGP